MGKLEMLNKVAVSTQYRGKALYNVSGRYQGWAYIRIELHVFYPSPFSLMKIAFPSLYISY